MEYKSLTALTIIALFILSFAPLHVASGRQPAGTPRFSNEFIPRVPGLSGIQPPLIGAPTGLASYGDAGQTQTQSVMGSLTINSLTLGPSFFPNGTLFTNGTASLQENAVAWVAGHGEYWTQNVLIIYQPNFSVTQVELINNIWNFTSATIDPMNPADVFGNGTTQQFNRNLGFYYFVDPVVYNLTMPFTVNLTMTLVDGNGAATVVFGYTIRSGSGQTYKGAYDKVTLFPNQKSVSSYYQIGGFASIGLASDLEYVFGGPGGGSFVYIMDINGFMELYSMQDSQYVPVKDAFSFGSDTAEYSVGANVVRSLGNPSVPEGQLEEGDLTLYQLWPTGTSTSLSYSVDYASGTVTLRGQVFYSQYSSGSPIVPVSGVTVQEEINNKVVSSTTTLGDGSYRLTWKPNQTGTYFVSVTYTGSTSLEQSTQQVEFSVSSINITGTPNQAVELFLNNSDILVQTGSELMVPVAQGTTVALTAPQIFQLYAEQRVRQVFMGVGPIGDLDYRSYSLMGNQSLHVAANFEAQYYLSVEDAFSVPQSGWYNAGTIINLSSPTYALTYGNPQERWVFDEWSDNGSMFNTSSIEFRLTSPVSAAAYYSLQYLVDVNTTEGASTFWMDKGSNLTLSAPKSIGGLATKQFEDWVGTYNSTQNEITVTVESPITETARYSTSYTSVYALVIIALLIGLGVGALIKRSKPKTGDPTPS
jgi:hypothetical protein